MLDKRITTVSQANLFYFFAKCEQSGGSKMRFVKLSKNSLEK